MYRSFAVYRASFFKKVRGLNMKMMFCGRYWQVKNSSPFTKKFWNSRKWNFITGMVSLKILFPPQKECTCLHFSTDCGIITINNHLQCKNAWLFEVENGVPTNAYDYETAKITSGNMEIRRLACLFVRLRNSTMKVQWKPFQSLLMTAIWTVNSLNLFWNAPLLLDNVV